MLLLWFCCFSDVLISQHNDRAVLPWESGDGEDKFVAVFRFLLWCIFWSILLQVYDAFQVYFGHSWCYFSDVMWFYDGFPGAFGHSHVIIWGNPQVFSLWPDYWFVLDLRVICHLAILIKRIICCYSLSPQDSKCACICLIICAHTSPCRKVKLAICGHQVDCPCYFCFVSYLVNV